MIPTAAKPGHRQYIGGYRIQAAIGIGASASVFRAVDETSGTEVAVKVLADNHSLVPEMRQRFLDEIDLLMAIASPAVATVLGRGETESGQPYLVMELADRGDLRHRMDRVRGRGMAPTAADLLVLARHLAVALSALHEAGIVHRDVSPGNLLISGGPGVGPDEHGLPFGGCVLAVGERYLLADLGFAKDMALASGLTAGGGTRGFTAPEQRDPVTLIDHRADVYSATALIAWVADGTDLQRGLEHFLATGMAADPDRRHRNMARWLTALEQALAVNPRTGAGANDAGRDRSGKRPWERLWERPLAGPGTGGSRSSRSTRGGAARLVAGLVIGGAAIATALALGTDTLDNDPPPVAATTPAPPGQDPSADQVPPAPSNPSATAADPSTAGRSTVAQSTVAQSIGAQSTGAQSTAVPSTVVQATATTPATAASIPAPAAPAATVTTLATTTTVADPRYAASPRAFIDEPADEAIITGDLRITGSGRYRQGLVGVELVIRRLADDHTWHEDSQSFQPEWLAFPLDVSPSGGTEVTWSYTLDRDRLEPGRYMIRVWANGSDANDPVSDRRYLTITG